MKLAEKSVHDLRAQADSTLWSELVVGNSSKNSSDKNKLWQTLVLRLTVEVW